MKFIYGSPKGLMGKFAIFCCKKLFWKDGCMVRSLVRLKRERLSEINFHPDYIRLAALELCAYKIHDNGIDGSVAELGVYKGDFARKINECFPNRKLYLFDTFSGFDQKQVIRESDFLKNRQNFLDTTSEFVLSRMKYPEICVIKKGVFPETAVGVEDKFVFVNLDADLFEPIYEGLNFFYPKLEAGGYIFVHDYNNYDWPGVRKAVDQFCRENNVGYVPVPDAHGTVIFLKPIL